MKTHLSDEAKGMIAASAAYVIFGFSYLFSKMALNVTEPLILLCCRFTLTFITLNFLVLTGICRISLKGKNLLLPVLVGLVQPCLYFILENYGLSYTTTAFTGMISSVSPIFTAILGAVVLKEKLSIRQWLFVLVSIAGVAMVSVGGSGGKNTVAGCVCLVAAYLSGSLYSLMIRRFSRVFTPFELTYVMFSVGFVFFAVMTFSAYRGAALTMMREALGHADFIVPVIYLGVGASVVAYFLANYSLSKLPVARSTIFTNLSTLVSVVSGIIIMGDPFGPLSVAAFALMLLGIWGVNRFRAADETAAGKK